MSFFWKIIRDVIYKKAWKGEIKRETLFWKLEFAKKIKFQIKIEKKWKVIFKSVLWSLFKEITVENGVSLFKHISNKANIMKELQLELIKWEWKREREWNREW